MDLSNLKPAEGSSKNSKRIGRGQGSGRGGTSTRGHKGAKSRSGYSKKVGFEGGQMPLQRRLPKVGFSSRKATTTTEVRLDVLQNLGLEVVDLLALKTAGVISENILRAKVIGSGEITTAVTVKGLPATAGAKKAIEAAGGKVEE